MASATIPVALAPSPGFCIKTASLDAGTYNVGSPERRAIAVPRGLKVFVNIAWDKNVPPPPEGSEDAIQRAMDGQDPDELNPDGWFVPVIVSPGREDTDKAGRPSLVFDCIFNPTLKSRTLKDAAFKTFLIELALQRIEAQTGLHLSRTIGTPNIASKGALTKRTARVPAALFPPGHPLHASAPAKPLIEEVAAPTKKGILKKADAGPALETPAWSWTQDGSALRITVLLPKLTRELVPQTTLELEPRRFDLRVPGLYELHIDADAPDAEIQRGAFLAGAGPGGAEMALMLKRARDLDVEGARAEWRVAEGRLVIWA